MLHALRAGGIPSADGKHLVNDFVTSSSEGDGCELKPFIFSTRKRRVS
jgi:hypothetical protein